MALRATPENEKRNALTEVIGFAEDRNREEKWPFV